MGVNRLPAVVPEHERHRLRERRGERVPGGRGDDRLAFGHEQGDPRGQYRDVLALPAVLDALDATQVAPDPFERILPCREDDTVLVAEPLSVSSM